MENNRPVSSNATNSDSENREKNQEAAIKTEEDAREAIRRSPFQSGIRPDERHLLQIKEVIGEKELYLAIWNVQILNLDGERKHFKEQDSLLVEVFCCSSPLLVDLQAEFSLDLVVIDLKTNHPQLFYCRNFQDALEYDSLKVTFPLVANLKGIYELRPMIKLVRSYLFQVWEEGTWFRVL